MNHLGPGAQGLQAASPLARQQRLQRAAESVRQLPWRRRREGLDHVALFGASAWQLPGSGVGALGGDESP